MSTLILMWSQIQDELLYTLTNLGVNCQGYAGDIERFCGLGYIYRESSEKMQPGEKHSGKLSRTDKKSP